MKRLVSLVLVMAIIAISSITTFAANREARQPDLYLDGKLLEFPDQTTYITDEGRTLVPVRGFFEELGFSVEWDEENSIVTVLSADGGFAIFFIIDNKTLYLFDDENQYEYQLDVPPQILNGRTMVPMYFVSDLFGYTVTWSESQYCVNILPPVDVVKREEGIMIFPGLGDDVDNTQKQQPEDVLKVSLTADKTDVNVGDEITVYVCVEGNGSYKPSGLQSIFNYDKTALEFIPESSAMIDADLVNQVAFLNFEQECEAGMEVMFVPVYSVEHFSNKIFCAKFKVLKDGDTSISLDNSYSDDKGYSTMVLLENPSLEDVAYEGNMLDMSEANIDLK